MKRIQYKDGRKLTATRRVELVMDDSQKEKDYYLEMSVRLRRLHRQIDSRLGRISGGEGVLAARINSLGNGDATAVLPPEASERKTILNGWKEKTIE